MPARGQRLPQGDRRERVPRVAECGEEEPSPVLCPVPCALGPQTSSATARIMSVRPSALQAIGVIISVPTPASR